jgi:Tfp pilus assembly protein PilW
MRNAARPGLASAAGYSLVELIVAMGVFTVVMGATMTGLANILQGNETVMTVAQINNSARAGMDLMVRDFLQVGSGLPSSHTVSIPNGNASQPIRIPGPPGSAFELPANEAVLPAVIPRSDVGPIINGVKTDVVTVLMADNAFLDVALSAVTNTTVTVAAGPIIDAGPDRVIEGQLMLISKGSFNTLVQVTDFDAANRVLTFAAGDSLRLNQPGAENGNLTFLNAQDPVNDPAATRISRMRMITYYMDNTDVNHPKLVRRVNNGHPLDFDNNLGTAVAIDAVDLQFTYDISNGIGNPGGVEMSEADLAGAGKCAPEPCAETQVRKINVMMKSRATARNSEYLYNVLESQVSLRAMAFVDRYRGE